ncbi:MAG TPA: elongation factor G [Thermodesulfobacteriota bacterium]|nr:elongation factor G [Thermodesulfobacteriota bacterium]
MKEYPRENVRNVGIVAHRGAGKTSLAEAMLYLSGATDKLGKVDDGSSILDYEAEEQKRKMSINTHVAFYEWNDHLVNLVDTPGFANFLYETESALRVVDGAIVIVSGITGVKAQTEKYWQMAADLGIPRLIFMNKLDRERANFENAIADIEKDLEVRPVPFTIPIGEEENFKGVVDLIEMKAFIYGDGGKYSVESIPEDLAEQAESWRERVVEAVAEMDDELLEKYLNGETFENALIYKMIREGVLSAQIVPVFVGSAAKLIGINLLMDAACRYLPSPLERPVIKGKNSKGEDVEKEPNLEESMSAFVFKTISDPYAGKMSILRVFSGSLKPDSLIYNSVKKSREKIGPIFRIMGKKQSPANPVLFGDIVVINKLKDTETGDSLSDDANPFLIPPVVLPQAVMSYAIQPKSRADEDKLLSSLSRVREEDPTIQFRRDEETNEFLLSGTGQVHVEVIVDKLKNTYGVSVDMKTPKVPYKETIRGTAKAEGKYIKQTGGRGQYGDAWLEIEPLTRSGGYEFVNKIVGGVIPKNFIPSVEKGVIEAMQRGTLAGYPVVDVRVTLFDGKHHPVDSSDIAFKIAGSMGFKKAMESAQPVLLEPVMRMEIFTPEDFLGDVIGDVNARRGKVSGVEPQSGGHVVKALVPMAEILTYAPELRSITSGQGMFTMEFSHYEEVPSHLASKIIEESAKEKAAGE